MLKFRGVTAVALVSGSLAAAGFAPAVHARNYHVLHSFAGPSGDGAAPRSAVTLDAAGNLFGTTYEGGASNNGTIFKIAPDGTETLLHSFVGSPDGANPAAGVTLDPATGDLYGVTHDGGSTGYGVLYKITPGGTFTVLHTFAGGPNDARYAQWQLIRDKRGNLYGVSQAGGTLDDGALFKYGANGKYKVLHSFDSTTAAPIGRLALDHDGNLYGASAVGGTSQACFGHGCGAIYRLSPNGTFVIMYSFNDGDDGRGPTGGLTTDKDDNVYGTTAYGGAGGSGTVFLLTHGGTFATLYSFNGANGDSPIGDVLNLGTNLYLTTYGGGTHGDGTIVKVSVHGVGTVLHNFTGKDGALPAAGLIKGKRVLYSTTTQGGPGNYGVVFALKK